VRDYEPEVALMAHEGGMFYIEKIIKEGPAYLVPGGWLLLEMDPGQTEKALGLISQDHRYTVGRRVRDYSQRHRLVMARKQDKGADPFEKIS
jgi:release factor glutamine methyltransferase